MLKDDWIGVYDVGYMAFHAMAGWVYGFAEFSIPEEEFARLSMLLAKLVLATPKPIQPHTYNSISASP